MKPQNKIFLLVAAYYSTNIVLGLVESSVGPLLPTLAQKYQANISQVSYIFPAHWLGYILASFVGGRLYDRVAGHRLLTVALITAGAALALAPFVPFFSLLAGIFFILGLVMGTLDVGSNTLLIWKMGDKVGPLMNGLHLVFGFSSILGPLIISRSGALLGEALRAYWVIALFVLVPIVLLFSLPTPKNPAAVQAQQQATAGTGKGMVFVLALFFAMHTGAELGFGGWIYSYTLRMQLGNETVATLLNSTFWASITLGRLIAIPVSMRVRTRTILLASLLGALGSMGVVLLWPESQTALWVATIGVGTSLATLYPGTLSFAGEIMPISGSITGRLIVGGSLGGMLLPWLIGQLFEPVGPRSSMWVIALAVGVGLVIFSSLLVYLRRADQKGVRV